MALQRHSLLPCPALVALLAPRSNGTIIVIPFQEGIDHVTTAPHQRQSSTWSAPAMRTTHPESVSASAQV